MTVGIGILYHNGIVLAADSLALNERGEIAHEEAQKLFQLGDNSGLIISGNTPYDPCDTGNLIEVPARRTAERLKASPLDFSVRRHVVLSVLAEEVKAYLTKAACIYPKKSCLIDVVFGDHDRDQGYLLLECQFEYSPTSEPLSSEQGECQEISVIYEAFAEDGANFVVKCFCRNCPPKISGIGMMGGKELVKKYPRFLRLFLTPLASLAPTLDDAVCLVNSLIAQIAQENPTVNDRAQIAVIDEKGYRESIVGTCGH